MGQVFGKSEHIDFNSEVELRHFNLLRCVGKGAFGKVRIVEHRDSKKLYALKYINKLQCIKIRAVQNIIRERYILEEIEHPFIVNLRYAFQDDENMFMVIDLMMGGDLRYHLDRLGGFSEEMVRFFASEISCALNYLHNKNILHRDLKPDNILLDTKGHSHITDFNIATKIDPKKLPRSQSGTLAYMAPEVFKGKGYSYSVDWWGLGVILYECLYGKRPFKGQNNEQLTMSIISPQDIRFPTCNSLTKYPVKVSQDCIMFLKGLLTKDPNQRLGCRPGIELDELWEHPWLIGIDWDKLERKEYVAPFIPDSDRANFDATYDLEELLLEDNPLVHKKKKKKEKNESKQKSHSTSVHSKHANHKSKLETEFEYIEKHFKIYDSSMFDRCKELIEKENLFSQLPPEIQQIASQAAYVNTNYNGKGPSGIVAAKLREKKLQVILFQQHVELQRQMEQKEINGNENMSDSNVSSNGSASNKEINNMNDLQAYYKKHIKINPNLINTNTNAATLNSPTPSQSPSTPQGYTQTLAHSNYATSINTSESKNQSPTTNKQPYTASISPVMKSPILKKSSPPLKYNNQNNSELELQEITMALKNMNPDSPTKPSNPKIISVPANATGQPVTKVYYNKSPKLNNGSPYNRYAIPSGSKTPTLEVPVYLSNPNEMDGMPPLVSQELQDINNPGYYLGRSNSPPLVDTPPRTASVGVLREIIPNPYLKKNPR
ncbi:kinase-like protein [Piromyces finnis]|uniref:Kinase-like protein n=1 Tax=Piromyces finnis TaxID=1754191 RepID=A0A1Y1UQU6_9FUNG|nr:kinase-like protein [Piromyces finnis]|eukprot:ORX40421.1 kinase-like protein [Piromyces finnis]